MIGDSINTFDEKLPTDIDVIKLFCSEWTSNKTENEKIARVVNSIKSSWDQAGLPSRSNPSIRMKVKNLIIRFKSIVSTRTKCSDAQKKREREFLENSNRLFDIIDQQSESKLCVMKSLFLSDQRNDRRMTFVDLNLNENADFNLMESANERDNSMESEDGEFETWSESEYDSASESNYYPSSSDDDDYSPKKKLKIDTIKAMDDAGLSFRQMQVVSEAFVKQFNENPNDYCIAASTFHSNSTRIRHETVENISEQLKHRNSKAVLLYDTKSFHELNAAHLSRKKRLAAVLYNEGIHFSLGINVIENGSADTLSSHLYDTSVEFNLLNRIVGLVCDTENANIGYRGGTCRKFETKIQKPLLQICCRHHVMEILLKKVCYKLLDKGKTPGFSFKGSDEININWKQINKRNYRPVVDEDFADTELLCTLRNQTIEQIQSETNTPVRDDYAELNDICLKLMNVETTKNVRVLGAISKARWIAKALLIGKTYLFREHLSLDQPTLEALKRICVFISHLYVKFWNRAPSATNAAMNDLLFMQQLEMYQEYDDEIAQTAIHSFKEHLWYLGGELVTLSLFSNHVSIDTKNRIRGRISRNIGERNIRSLKFSFEETTQFVDMNLEDFIDSRSFFLFQLLDTTADFLQQDAATWNHITSYITIKKIVEETIIVINDGAERLLGNADKIIRTQKARKEKYFKNLLFMKFDKNKRE